MARGRKFQIDVQFARSLLEERTRKTRRYATSFSPKKFTQPQLLTLLDIKALADAAARIEYSNLPGAKDEEFAANVRKHISGRGEMSYRDLIWALRDSPNLVRALGLRVIPNYSTLAHAKPRFKSLGFWQSGE